MQWLCHRKVAEMPRVLRLPSWLPRSLLVGCFLLTPAVEVSLLLAVRLNASLLDCAPSWGDEVHYWNEVACFVRAGFDGGYCVADERTAAATWSHFGPHGPGFPVSYGLLGRVLGWHPVSGPFFHLIVLMFGAA